MRENRMLRLTWRGLETESRSELIRARHARKGGNRRSRDLRITAPVLDPTWTFMREFSPIELREGRDEKDIWADWGRCSVRTVLGEARTHTGLHIVEAKRRFP